MNHATDFARLYAELGVSPQCGLHAFKQAYRRRVAELHPDRPATGPRDPDRLIALNLGYAAALDFHRARGRLPGAPAHAAGTTAQTAPLQHGSQWNGRHMQARTASPTAQLPPSATRHAMWMRSVLTVLIVAGATWHWLPASEEPAAPAAESPQAAPFAEAPMDVQLVPGMDRRTVAVLLGEPMVRDASDSLWMYGPSWVHFECGRLADWHNTPLHPLPVATQRPQHATAGGARRTASARPRACADHAAMTADVAPQAHGDD
ncbi:J domain-containing protein [Luteimonas sp. MC1572]|uniref:J domain-containing protein n=1 Tax=Luteimonas sp. MC1572 TaxID=2799325 RepID=UPI0018F06BD3|nr:J domain-containing protein [Luteimonas sp. MC1572]MBJ6982871.1 J domain-containing protein [Luteimonas sp. MC1572]QQO04098.1 J domain-containing protein [Luteimonas sp. MC1572]